MVSFSFNTNFIDLFINAKIKNTVFLDCTTFTNTKIVNIHKVNIYWHQNHEYYKRSWEWNKNKLLTILNMTNNAVCFR
jgi:hypothetical protein